MPNKTKGDFLNQLAARYGRLRKLDRSQSLYDIEEGTARVYVRYSKVHEDGRTFYGFRAEDLRRLMGHSSVICLLWNGQEQPVTIPFTDFEDVFRATSPAHDGQYKAQVYLHPDGRELYVAQAGRFNIEGYIGWNALDLLVESSSVQCTPELSHSQVQTLLGAIGANKEYEIWIPRQDRSKLDWSLVSSFHCCDVLPTPYDTIRGVLEICGKKSR